MIEMRRAQLSFGDGLIAAEVDDLREPWMAHADAVLADKHASLSINSRRHVQARRGSRLVTGFQGPKGNSFRCNNATTTREERTCEMTLTFEPKMA